MTDPFPDSKPLREVFPDEFGETLAKAKRDPVFRAAYEKASVRRDRGYLRLHVTPGYTLPEPEPTGTGWYFADVSDQLLWVRCRCPWWHRLPFVSRRVHSDLP